MTAADIDELERLSNSAWGEATVDREIDQMKLNALASTHLPELIRLARIGLAAEIMGASCGAIQIDDKS